ncbi:facilitated trehalose transporter Tret1-2 homolog [Lasioglossum baleicum]|uniref:facilitated trehalose transporter Tret1-2 homolog n=1 Tax=Lasioglossum baleicum TaxID=434251 RepID=UPI003FCCD91D
MNEKSLGISQHVLVTNGENHSVPAKKLPQYVASLSSTLGALAAGMVLGWTSSAGTDGADLASQYNISISPTEFSWMGSLTTLGAGVMCIPIGILTDFIGRKTSMLLMVVPFIVGWLLIICSNSVVMFYVGRFITGLASGAFCVAAPMYTAEISESSIRGSLGSYFQLLLTVGIFLSYLLGNWISMFALSIVSAIAPLVFFVVFIFMPESPRYYLQKGNEDAARKSLIKLYGEQYDIDGALNSQLEAIEENRRNKVSFSTMIKSRVTMKGFVIGYGLMIFQQFSGVNTIVFYGSSIFAQAASSLTPGISMIIIGVIQFAAVFISTLLVDRLGRRILLLASIVCLFLSTFALGVYYYLLEIKEDVSSITWLPLLSICVFVIMFSFGFGPLPWMMMGEIFAPEVKGVAASSAGLLNWLMAFLVTKFYTDLKVALGTGGTFWLFSGISAIGIFFVYILVPETKGKSLESILRDL